MAAYLLENAPDGCGRECLIEHAVVQQWLIDGDLSVDVEIPYDPNRTVVKPSRPICSAMFDFVEQYPGSNTVYEEASGIQGLIIEINDNGQLRHFGYTNYVFSSKVDCSESEQNAAKAINDGIACASARFTNNNYFPGGYNQVTKKPMTQIEIVNATIQICIYKAFGNLMNQNVCNPGTSQNPPTTTVVGFDAKVVKQYQADQNYDVGTFINFGSFNTKCP